MPTKIVFLRPKGAGLFRSQLRSDTLFGALCWSLQTITNGLLKDLLPGYHGDSAKHQPFFLSSAFPFLEDAQGNRSLFLPHPMEPYRNFESDKKPADAQAAKQVMRNHKRSEKRQTWISWEAFNTRFAGNDSHLPPNVLPKVSTRAVTHNSIDRRYLGTTVVADSGQLFHTNENYLDWDSGDKSAHWKPGLYFLVQGNFDLIKPALRFLEHFGIAGDRGTGKGHFQIDWETIELPESPNANARLNLSLYHPTASEAKALDASSDRLFRYRLVDRQGRHLHQKEYRQPGYFFFGEGSVFPLIPELGAFPGKNLIIGNRNSTDDVQRYGRGFMLNIKIQ
jgi:CRISPR-associated protein Csm4